MLKRHIYIPFLLVVCLILQACSSSGRVIPVNGEFSINNITPKPFYTEATGRYMVLTETAAVYCLPGTIDIGNQLADYLTSLNFKVILVNSTDKGTGDFPSVINIYTESDVSLGNEGYKIITTSGELNLSANGNEGLSRGVQTIKQLLMRSTETGEWLIPCGVIRDHPRFGWRGTMLDVARHFFTVDEVKKYIDKISLYKINRFHLHLTDDQGWRIQVDSWPELTKTGSTSSVNNEKPGYYTKQDYKEIVKYAADRYITVIPEIDMPSHTNAALASYPELNCNDSVKQLYTGIEVGFSSLCVNKDITYKFVTDVVKEIAEMTPGDYIHIGGDEASSTDSADYVYFINRVQDIVNAAGKKMIGWEEIVQAKLNSSSVAQVWRGNFDVKNTRVIISPASLMYLDMKYNSSTSLGLNWAGYIDVHKSYNWDPAEYIKTIPVQNIMGVEAPLWSETLKTWDDINYMAFPRLISAAEIGWSLQKNRNWEDFKRRISPIKY